MNWYILAVFPVFGLLVIVHEFGHFITAKWAGIRVEEFGLGLPPALVGIRKRERGGWEFIWFGRGRETDSSATQNPFSGSSGGMTNFTEGARTASPQTSGAELVPEDQRAVRTFDPSAPDRTIYSLNLLPIGGFVRMPGENGDVLDPDGNYDPKSFAAKPAGKRIIVLCAGVIMNFLLAMVLFSIAYGLGEPTYPSVIDTVQPASPAHTAGVHSNDTILAVNGTPVKTFDDMRAVVNKEIANDKGKHNTVEVVLKIKRAGEPAPITKTVYARTHATPEQGAMGVSGKIVLVSSPVWQAPFKGIAQTFTTLGLFFDAIRQMIIGAVQPQFAGPVGIARMTGTVAQAVPSYGWFPILSFTAFLSLNLAIINILPFPALDGGRILLILIEILRGGKRLKPEREGLINFIGFAILLLLMVVVTVSDVLHWGS